MSDYSLLQDFIVETGEHLEETERNLLQLEQNPGNVELLNEIFRSVHTIKGSSEYLGMQAIAELSHRLENLLDLLRRGERRADSAVVDLLVTANDRLNILVSDLQQHQQECTPVNDLLARIDAFTGTVETLSAEAVLPDASVQTQASQGEAYEEENDEELFGIFADQLKEGIRELVHQTDSLLDNPDPEAVWDRCIDYLETLKSSANYMGYDKLKNLYNQWIQSIDAYRVKYRGRTASGTDIDAAVFARDVMAHNLDQVQKFFPKMQGLQEIATTKFAEDRPAESMPPDDAVSEFSFSDMHAALDEKLDAANNVGLEPDLLSASEQQPADLPDQGLLADFIDETGEHLEETGRNLLQLEQNPDNVELLNEIFRSVHTIKGSSEYLGMQAIAELSHRLENLLDLLRRGERRADSAVVDLLMAANDRLNILVGDLQQHQQECTPVNGLLARIDAFTENVETLSAEAGVPDTSAQTQASQGEAYEEENDEELFGIFADQLKEGIRELVNQTDSLLDNPDPEAVWDRCIDCLETLRSSANYMGYDKLTNLYDHWIQSIDAYRVEYRGLTASGTDIDAAVFARDVMAHNLDQVQKFFPQMQGLQEIATTKFAEDRPAESMPPDDAVSEFSFSDMHAALDEKLDAANNVGLEPDLLSASEQQPADLPDQDLLADFIDETGEHLEETGRNLLQLEQNPGNVELLNEIFRSVHTIKGSSEYLGMQAIAELSHRLENLLDLLRRGERRAESVVVDLLKTAHDRLNILVTDLQQHQQERAPIDDLVLQITAYINEQGTGGEGQVQSEAISILNHETSKRINEEYDQELFKIFLEQLRVGLQNLSANADKLQSEHDDAEPVLHDCAAQIRKLRASANYMEYDDLCQLYDAWIQSIILLSDEYASKKYIDAAAFVRNEMIPYIAQIRNEFGLSDAIHPVEKTENKTEEKEADPQFSLFSQLATAFDESIGEVQKDNIASFSADIENGLFSDTFSIECPPENSGAGAISRRQGTADPIESLFFPDSGKQGSTRAIISEALIDPDGGKRSSPLAETEKPGRRSPFKIGRRQADKTSDRISKQSIRVDAAKIDALMNQVGELVVRRSGFNQLFNEMRGLQSYLKHTQKLDSKEFQQIKSLTNKISEATVALGRVTTELQENVMRVRMLPIAQLFSRYPRLVHDLVRNTSKKVNLEIHGEDTELDKIVIEQIADPLVHIIRNAVDHGIEDVSERQRKGKPETGRLILEAYHESNYVVIDISDDGRGIDPVQIQTRAVEKGFITSEQAEKFTEHEIVSFILQPGFSTTDEITHTSGRGVGMDVVKDHIEKLNGTLDIFNTPGAGVLLRIKIPLTLAIIPALMVTVAGELFTIPLSTVDETMRVRSQEINRIEGLEVYYLRDAAIPLIRLDQLFNMQTTAFNAQEMFMVVVNSAGRQVGLIVDQLNGRDEVVIKPLEDYLQEKSGFSGATILGDGSISLILDIYEIVQLSMKRHAKKINAAVI